MSHLFSTFFGCPVFFWSSKLPQLPIPPGVRTLSHATQAGSWMIPSNSSWSKRPLPFSSAASNKASIFLVCTRTALAVEETMKTSGHQYQKNHLLVKKLLNYWVSMVHELFTEFLNMLVMFNFWTIGLWGAPLKKYEKITGFILGHFLPSPLFLAHHDDIIIGCHVEGDLQKNAHDHLHDLRLGTFLKWLWAKKKWLSKVLGVR